VRHLFDEHRAGGARERGFAKGWLARTLVQVGQLGAAARAAKALPQREHGEIPFVALNETRHEENASVFAAPAHSDKRHLRIGQLWRACVHSPASSVSTADRLLARRIALERW
jgi:hypothetical protein